MPVLFGTREAATIGAQKHLTFTYPAARETLLEVPVTLPLAEPGSPQLSFTILEGDVPTMAGATDDGALYPALVYVAGAAGVAEMASISFKYYLNGDLITSQTVTADSPFWTLNLYSVTNVAVGDVLEVALWADVADCSYDYTAIAVHLSRPGALVAGTLLLNATYTTIFQGPELFGGDPLAHSSGYTAAYILSGESDPVFAADLQNDGVVSALTANADSQLYQVWYGDQNTGAEVLNGIVHPIWRINSLPLDISYYPTSIRVI